MNTYDRFLSTLLSEFKRRAPPQVRSLWADLMELAEATDERALFAARGQALRRIRVLGRAASAANAHQVQSLGQAIEHTLEALTQARAAARPELIEGLYGTMRRLAEALYAIDAEAPVLEYDGQSAEMELVACGAD